MRAMIASFVLLLAGCASSTGVSHKLEYCCGAQSTPLTSYTLTLNDVPGFLVPYVRDELVAALAAKGMRLVTVAADAHVTLSYREIYPDAEDPLPDDGFGDPLATARSRRFIAVVTLQIERTSDGAEILRGTLSRMHTVSVGEYMHQRARATIRSGFDHLLKRLPQQ